MKITKKQWDWLRKSVGKNHPNDSWMSGILEMENGCITSDGHRIHQIWDFSAPCTFYHNTAFRDKHRVPGYFRDRPKQDLVSRFKEAGHMVISSEMADALRGLRSYPQILWHTGTWDLSARVPFFEVVKQPYIPDVSYKSPYDTHRNLSLNPKYLTDAFGTSDEVCIAWEAGDYGAVLVTSLIDGVECKAMIMPMRMPL